MKTLIGHLRRFTALILILHSVTTHTRFDHELTYVVGCFKDGPTQVQFEFDSEEILYVDFDNSSVVFTTPAFSTFDITTILTEQHILANAKKGKKACSAIMTFLIGEEGYPPQNTDPPESALYSAEEVVFGSENTLICFVNHFFPPDVKISWTKNDEALSEGVSVSRYFPNSDLTFHLFSTLMFTPSPGDIYTCTVEHVALDRPITRFWESNAPHESHSMGLDIYCGVGIVLGLLGFATGIFFFVKGMIQRSSVCIGHGIHNNVVRT